MTLQSSGAISLNEIHVEAGGTSGTQASTNDSDIRGLIGKSSETLVGFNEWYGASSYTPSLRATYSSSLTSQPSWLYISSGNTKNNSWRGFNSSGMWISANSTGYCWPVLTMIPELQNGYGTYTGNTGATYGMRKAILKVSIYKNHGCADHGICINKVGRASGGNYYWYWPYDFWGANTRRITPIAYNCGSPTYFPYTGSYSWTGYGSNPAYLSTYSYWQGIRITMIPEISCQVEIFANNWTSSSSVSYSTSYRRVNTTHTSSGMTSVNSLSPTPGYYDSIRGGYQFWFDADQDDTTYYSYWKDLSIEVWG